MGKIINLSYYRDSALPLITVSSDDGLATMRLRWEDGTESMLWLEAGQAYEVADALNEVADDITAAD